jgi:hypothetical protein
MGNELQKLLEEERLKEHRIRLNKFTNEKYKWQKEIIMVDEKNIDDLHTKFISENNDLSFNDVRIVRYIFEWIKKELKKED